MCLRSALSAPAVVGNAETSRNDHGVIVVGRCLRRRVISFEISDVAVCHPNMLRLREAMRQIHFN